MNLYFAARARLEVVFARYPADVPRMVFFAPRWAGSGRAVLSVFCVEDLVETENRAQSTVSLRVAAVKSVERIPVSAEAAARKQVSVGQWRLY